MEFIVNWCGAICAVGYAVIFLGLGLPMALRKIPRNRLYGFRTPATLADDDVWYPVNEMAGGNMVALGVIFLLMAVASIFLMADRIMQLVLMGLVTLVMAVGLSISMLKGFRLSASILKAKKEGMVEKKEDGREDPAKPT